MIKNSNETGKRENGTTGDWGGNRRDGAHYQRE